MSLTDSRVGLPPGTAIPARRIYQRFRGPIERFLHLEAATGLVLIGSALFALGWANSPWHESYEELWETSFKIGFGPWTMEESLEFWINDFLMTVFFLVAGLEIKREIVEGALSNMRRAALPMAGALGGMVVPALLFYVFNHTGPSASGWAIPMATDIAFAIGITIMLGDRIPGTIRILLLALAIVDDLGGILVIAFFYSKGFDINGLFLAAAGVALLFAMRRAGVRPGKIFVIPTIVVWAGCHEMGIHPTIAGVIVGLSAPVKPWINRQQFLAIVHESIDDFAKRSAQDQVDEHELLAPLHTLSVAEREVVSPITQGVHNLHPLVSFLIIPLFALANSGVAFSSVDFSAEGATSTFIGIILGLGIGKPLGILLFCWLAVKAGLCVLPADVSWKDMLFLGTVAGIGFTMCIFIGDLAFESNPGLLGTTKLAVLLATALAAIGAFVIGTQVLGVKENTVSAGVAESSNKIWLGEGGLEALIAAKEKEQAQAQPQGDQPPAAESAADPSAGEP